MACRIKNQVDAAERFGRNGPFRPIHINTFASAYNFDFKRVFPGIFKDKFGSYFFPFLHAPENNGVLLKTQNGIDRIIPVDAGRDRIGLN